MGFSACKHLARSRKRDAKHFRLRKVVVQGNMRLLFCSGDNASQNAAACQTASLDYSRSLPL